MGNCRHWCICCYSSLFWNMCNYVGRVVFREGSYKQYSHLTFSIDLHVKFSYIEFWDFLWHSGVWDQSLVGQSSVEGKHSKQTLARRSQLSISLLRLYWQSNYWHIYTTNMMFIAQKNMLCQFHSFQDIWNFTSGTQCCKLNEKLYFLVWIL